MRKFLILTLCLMTLIPAALLQANYDQNDPDPVIQKAIADVKTANDLAGKAGAVLKRPGGGRKSIEEAIKLYAQAGSLFESATRVFEAVGPAYISPDMISSTRNAMNECVKAIQTLKQQAQKL